MCSTRCLSFRTGEPAPPPPPSPCARRRCAATPFLSCGGLTVLKSIATTSRPLKARIRSIPSRAVSLRQPGVRHRAQPKGQTPPSPAINRPWFDTRPLACVLPPGRSDCQHDSAGSERIVGGPRRDPGVPRCGTVVPQSNGTPRIAAQVVEPGGPGSRRMRVSSPGTAMPSRAHRGQIVSKLRCI